MNTGVQRSSATQRGSSTTTAPAGKVINGKQQNPKDLTEIMVAHNIPYVAQTTVGMWPDATKKFEKAFEITGAKFVNIYSPCIPGWGIETSQTIKLSKLVVDTCMWPIYEVENGKYKINYKPATKLPVTEFYKTQARFKALLKDEAQIKLIQDWVDAKWARLQLMEEATNKA